MYGQHLSGMGQRPVASCYEHDNELCVFHKGWVYPMTTGGTNMRIISDTWA